MKALIPAAGLGKRWFPWSQIIPKELLPFGSFPVIHYVLNEIDTSGIKEIGIVINESKQLIKSYVEEIWIVNHPEIRIAWFYQPSPRGVGDALLCAKDWVNGEPTAVLYPDEIHPEKGGINEICKAFQSFPGCWIGLASKNQERRQMPLAVKKINEVVYHISGPCDQECAEEVKYSTGRYILANGFSHIQDTFPQRKNQNSVEFDDDLIFVSLWNQDVRGIVLTEPIYDMGSPQNWRYAISQFS